MSTTLTLRLLPLPFPLALLAAACEPVPNPIAPDVTSLRLSAQQGSRTSTFPNLDGSFGPVMLASCDEGYDLFYQQVGTVTVIETTDKTGNITKLQNVWNLTLSVTNSVTGYALSGPSHGPDHITFNSDGTARLLQIGLLGRLSTPDGGTQLVDAGTVEFLIDENGRVSIVEMHGPHPNHEGFPERPVLCALTNH